MDSERPDPDERFVIEGDPEDALRGVLRAGHEGIISCGYCGHPGAHAGVLPPDGSGRVRCSDCTVCQRELAEERSQR